LLLICFLLIISNYILFFPLNLIFSYYVFGPADAAAAGAGSTATDAAKSCSRQPASIAPPMRPQPTSRIGGMLTVDSGRVPDPHA
jgi:hypothetical protein